MVDSDEELMAAMGLTLGYKQTHGYYVTAGGYYPGETPSAT